jgi:DivIVA domain-containing protein
MAQSVTPEGFNVARGRGYHPEQVDAFVADLSAGRDAAWERAARLTVLANEMDAEAAALRGAAEALGPVSYEALGEGAQELFRQVEAEAADVRDRGEAAARGEYQAVERDARALRDRARADADACLAAAEEAAQGVHDAARRQAADLLGAAQAEADRLDAEAERALEGVRQDIARSLADLEKEQRARLDALERELAEREAVIDARVGDLMTRAEQLLRDAQQEHADAHESARRTQSQAEAAASEIIAQAHAAEERVNHDSDRALRAHESDRDEIRAHLAHVRTSLSTLTGRTLPPEDDDH